jgi:hypothetical protein
MTLPRPGSQYSQVQEAERNRALMTADAENHKRNSDVYIVGGTRLILVSPNGTKYSVVVANDGTLSTEAA